jgi:acetyltransferase-like isoleucine patch superfamily enzyme
MWSHPTKDFVSTHPIFFSTWKQCQISFSDKSYYDELNHEIKIWNDVWIWANVLIPSSVKIWNWVIVAAWSIVTKDIPDYAIVWGIPAKIIRFRFDKKEIDFLLKYQWWDKDINWLKNNFKKFHNIKNIT